MNDKILNAALELAAEKPWEEVSLGDIARAAELSLADLRAEVACKLDILNALHARLDERMLTAIDRAAPPADGAQAKDRLFDLFMARFDALQEKRAAYLSVFESLKSQPKILLASLGPVMGTMRWALEASGVKAEGVKADLQTGGLALAYLNGLRAWTKDETSDLSATMASVDKGLARLTRYF